MARVTVEDCLDQVNSRFALVHLAVRRVLQMRKGHPVFVDAPKNKEIVRALREIAAGDVTIENIRELEAGPDSPDELEAGAETGELTQLEEPVDGAAVEAAEPETVVESDDVESTDDMEPEVDVESEAEDDALDEDAEPA